MIIYDAATTLNGWIADERNSLDWLFAVPGGDAPSEGLYPADVAVQVMGSTTYEWVLAHERLIERPERWTELYGSTPVFVFSRRELVVPEGADVRVVSGLVRDVLPTIVEAAGGGNIWVVGGGDLAGQFHDAGALDRIALSLAPTMLTGGSPVFPRRIEAHQLTLVEARAVGEFVRVVYDVTHAAGA